MMAITAMKETNILKWEDSITFPARDTLIDPNEFFNREGIYISDSFQEYILPVFRPVISTPERTYKVASLKKKAFKHKILLDLPKRYLGNWEDIASLIEMYPNGKAGYYLLYMEGVGGDVYTVDVRWLYAVRGWLVGGWLLDRHGYCHAGHEVLCPDPDNEVS